MKFIVEYWNGHGWSDHAEFPTLTEAQHLLMQMKVASAGARLVVVLQVIS